MRLIGSLLATDQIEATVTITATLGEWRALRKQLNNSQWPGWQLHSVLRDFIVALEKQADEPKEFSV